MPGIHELELFREELTRLGDERAVTAQRGETFEELPLPEEFTPDSPDIDVDSLISSLGGETPSTSDASPEPAFDTESAFSGAPEPSFDTESAFTEQPAFPGDAEPSADLSALDDILASLNLDEPPAAAPEPPSAEPELPADAELPADTAPSAEPDFPSVSDFPKTSTSPEEPSFPDLGDLGDLSSLGDFGATEQAAEEPAEEPIETPVPEGLFTNLAEPGEVDISNDFSIPEGLLTGLADEIEAERQNAPPSPEPDFNLDDLGDLGNLDSFEDAGSMEDIGSLEDLGNMEDPGAIEDLGEPESSAAPDGAIAGLDALLEKGLPSLEEESTADTDFSEMDFTPDFEGITRQDSSFGGDFPEPDVELSSEPESGLEPEALPDLDLDEGLESAPEEPLEEFDMPDFGAPSEGEASGDTGTGGLGGFDLDALELGTEAAESGGSDIPSMAEALASMGGDDFSDMSLPSDFSFPGDGGPEQTGGSAELDGFEGFSLDEDFLKNTIDNVGDEEFHIPGFADFASGSFDQSLSDISAASRSSGGRRKEVPSQISDEEMERFLSIISKYPLNLRIAAEEYLSGDAGSDQQKMELVHSILRETPLRKIAHILSDALGKTIEVPKDFEKKTFADYEEEKASLRYVFFNKILPIFTMAVIAAVLLSCVAYLSYQFIYRPIAAENLYRRGYAAIDNELYTQSQDLFNQAVVKWEKKNWYFKYAESYRDHRQYLLAERMYLALLARYNNDKKAGLDYAGMLLNDLRNFEKAETVLRRRVLDNYVNDPDGLMLLGDTFLEWADENPSKFEEARKNYAALIELYGSKDPYLARMMRYFIRTDNLSEVLPLKDRFLPKGSKISAQDLVELGGYLVDKRYEPKPGDSEALRNRIEDLRTVLERAVKADDSIPEAHYNMGRFLIYNYNPDLAYRALDYARSLYENVRTMTPRRVLTRVDTYRLMGELREDDGEYLDALDLYAQGIDLYERQRENGSVRQDQRVGLLYADSADIDYFLADDHGDALDKYESAIAELHDTPSIRYRVGYLEYRGGDYGKAYDSFLLAHADVPEDRNVLYAVGNTLMHRDDIFLAQGYYELLMGSLDAERLRKGVTFPSSRADFRDFVEEYVKGSNNLGVSLYRIAERNGDSKKYARAAALFSESIRASDSLTRDQTSMIRSDAQALAALNLRNMSHPASEFKPEIYVDIPQLMQGEEPLKQREDR